MNANLTERLKVLSRELVAAEHAGDWEEADRIEDEIAEIETELEELAAQEYDSRHHKDWY